MEGDRGLSTPLPSYVKFSQVDNPKSEKERAEMAKIPYMSAVVSLIYAMVATYSNIALVVGAMSRYIADPGQEALGGSEGYHEILKGY